VYVAAGQPVAQAEIGLGAGVAAAAEVDLLEERIGELPVVDDRVRLTLRPFEIKTIRFELRPRAKDRAG
jgi:alpha-mannosidase